MRNQEDKRYRTPEEYAKELRQVFGRTLPADVQDALLDYQNKHADYLAKLEAMNAEIFNEHKRETDLSLKRLLALLCQQNKLNIAGHDNDFQDTQLQEVLALLQLNSPSLDRILYYLNRRVSFDHAETIIQDNKIYDELTDTYPSSPASIVQPLENFYEKIRAFMTEFTKAELDLKSAHYQMMSSDAKLSQLILEKVHEKPSSEKIVTTKTQRIYGCEPSSAIIDTINLIAVTINAAINLSSQGKITEANEILKSDHFNEIDNFGVCLGWYPDAHRRKDVSDINSGDDEAEKRKKLMLYIKQQLPQIDFDKVSIKPYLTLFSLLLYQGGFSGKYWHMFSPLFGNKGSMLALDGGEDIAQFLQIKFDGDQNKLSINVVVKFPRFTFIASDGTKAYFDRALVCYTKFEIAVTDPQDLFVLDGMSIDTKLMFAEGVHEEHKFTVNESKIANPELFSESRRASLDPIYNYRTELANLLEVIPAQEKEFFFLLALVQNCNSRNPDCTDISEALSVHLRAYFESDEQTLQNVAKCFYQVLFSFDNKTAQQKFAAFLLKHENLLQAYKPLSVEIDRFIKDQDACKELIAADPTVALTSIRLRKLIFKSPELLKEAVDKLIVNNVDELVKDRILCAAIVKNQNIARDLPADLNSKIVTTVNLKQETYLKGFLDYLPERLQKRRQRLIKKLSDKNLDLSFSHVDQSLNDSSINESLLSTSIAQDEDDIPFQRGKLLAYKKLIETPQADNNLSPELLRSVALSSDSEVDLTGIEDPATRNHIAAAILQEINEGIQKLDPIKNPEAPQSDEGDVDQDNPYDDKIEYLPTEKEKEQQLLRDLLDIRQQQLGEIIGEASAYRVVINTAAENNCLVPEILTHTENVFDKSLKDREDDARIYAPTSGLSKLFADIRAWFSEIRERLSGKSSQIVLPKSFSDDESVENAQAAAPVENQAVDPTKQELEKKYKNTPGLFRSNTSKQIGAVRREFEHWKEWLHSEDRTTLSR